MIAGTWYRIGRFVYVAVNAQGTVENIGIPSNWRVFKLFWLNVIGRKTTVAEIRDYLRPNRVMQAKPRRKVKRSNAFRHYGRGGWR
jgi:hypothetical protein